jgi:hypothetical protein
MPGAGDAFYELSKRLKKAEKGVRAQFHADMKKVAAPLIPAIRDQATARFPTRGGLNKHMARGARYRTVAKTGLETAGVTILAQKTDPRVDTQGRIVHPIPVRGTSYTISKTSVKTKKTTTKRAGGEFVLNKEGKRMVQIQFFPEAIGFFSNTIEERADLIRADLIRRMERWAIDNLSGDIGG